MRGRPVSDESARPPAPTLFSQPKEIFDIRDFLQKARRSAAPRPGSPVALLTSIIHNRKDAKSVKIKKTKGIVKFKIRCSRVRAAALCVRPTCTTSHLTPPLRPWMRARSTFTL